jgi:hypothetical protein
MLPVQHVRKYIMNLLPEELDNLRNGVLTSSARDLLYLVLAVLDAGVMDHNIYLQMGHDREGKRHMIYVKGMEDAPTISGEDWETLSESIKNACEALLKPL